MPQYILKYPNYGTIYSANNPKEAGKKAFLDLCKYNNYDQSRITILENNSKKEFNFLGMTNNKLDQYDKVLKSKNPIQIGGSNMISDKDFYNKISEISGNINLSMDELTKILKLKYEPNDNDIILLVKDGLNKLNTLNENVNIIKNNINKLNEIPVDMKANQMPVDMKANQMPVDMKAEIPVDMKANQIPLDMKDNQIPADMKANQIPVDMKDNQIPVDMKANQIPVDLVEGINTSEESKKKTKPV